MRQHGGQISGRQGVEEDEEEDDDDEDTMTALLWTADDGGVDRMGIVGCVGGYLLPTCSQLCRRHSQE